MSNIRTALSNFSISKAHKAQLLLSKKIIRDDCLLHEIKLIAGVDIAYTRTKAICVAVVSELKSLEILEEKTVIGKITFPYIPTLLSFREIPLTIACIRRLKTHPDIFLADGHGVAHPYKCGFASHLGLILGKPTIGVAKSILFGKPKKVGDELLLVHHNRVLGAVVITKEKSKPVYVSIGHKISLETAVKLVKNCSRNSRIPKPILQAHKIASEKRKNLKENHKEIESKIL